MDTFEVVFNKRWIRYLMGSFIVFPVAFFSVFAGLYGLMCAVVAVRYIIEGDPRVTVMAYLSVVTAVGWAGIMGGVRRVTRPTDKMTNKYRRKTRIMLCCGVLASFSLTVAVLLLPNVSTGRRLYEEMWVMSGSWLSVPGFMLAITCAGVLLLVATPKNSELAAPDDAPPYPDGP